MLAVNIINMISCGALVVVAALVIGAIVWNIRQSVKEKSVTPDIIVIWAVCGLVSLGTVFSGIMAIFSVILA
jgi:hypothetical protein